MSNSPIQDSTEVIIAERIVEYSILHPWNFVMVVAGIVVLMAAYSLLVKHPFWRKS